MLAFAFFVALVLTAAALLVRTGSRPLSGSADVVDRDAQRHAAELDALRHR